MARPLRLDDFSGPARDRAQRAVLDQPSADDERSANVREKEEQAACVKLFREAGCKVYTTSEPRRKKSSPGVPDLLVFDLSHDRFFFWETKRQVGGVLSEMQQEFASECDQCNTGWYSGDRYDARKVLKHFEGQAL